MPQFSTGRGVPCGRPLHAVTARRERKGTHKGRPLHAATARLVRKSTYKGNPTNAYHTNAPFY